MTGRNSFVQNQRTIRKFRMHKSGVYIAHQRASELGTCITRAAFNTLVPSTWAFFFFDENDYRDDRRKESPEATHQPPAKS